MGLERGNVCVERVIVSIDVNRVKGHKEWTTRKIDPTYDMNWRRARVAATAQEDSMSQAEVNQIINYVEAAALVTRATAAEHIAALSRRSSRVLLVSVANGPESPQGGIFALAVDHCEHVRPDEIKSLLELGAEFHPVVVDFAVVRMWAQQFGLPTPMYRHDDNTLTTDLQEEVEAVRNMLTASLTPLSEIIAARVVALDDNELTAKDASSVAKAVVAQLLEGLVSDTRAR